MRMRIPRLGLDSARAPEPGEKKLKKRLQPGSWGGGDSSEGTAWTGAATIHRVRDRLRATRGGDAADAGR